MLDGKKADISPEMALRLAIVWGEPLMYGWEYNKILTCGMLGNRRIFQFLLRLEVA
ncbi:hypothetical protein [Brenneria izbisi]|uniref:Uncharacterized protein n=1 Tax=Brenneria izbisi TaxID=2939450 RepID=A0AA41XYJ0_9GAMM|nr:hypothetical protein [Brenneria izbisi]MCV9879868.1 hypothetical protein [Brenneria izbisi]MCV9883257.1 hypothetical protein [Brenneria izbisi]